MSKFVLTASAALAVTLATAAPARILADESRHNQSGTSTFDSFDPSRTDPGSARGHSAPAPHRKHSGSNGASTGESGTSDSGPNDSTAALYTAKRWRTVKGEKGRQNSLRLLAECERVRAHAGVQKFNLKCPVGNFAVLSHELIKFLASDHAAAVCVDIGPVIFARLLAVDRHAKPNGLAVGTRSENEMQIAGVKSVNDAARRRIECRVFGANRPSSRQRPFVEIVRSGCVIVRNISLAPPGEANFSARA